MDTTINNVFKLRKVIECDASYIPDFIDTTSYTDRRIYDIMKEMYVIISKLSENKILTENRHNVIVDMFGKEVDKLIIIASYNIIYLIHQKLMDSLDGYIEVCEDLELYEIAHNMKKFRDVI